MPVCREGGHCVADNDSAMLLGRSGFWRNMQTLDESGLQKARLIPVTGIKGALDQESRATSALLAVIKIVPELAFELLKDMKVPKGTIETYIEPEFKSGTKKIRPDGLIVITRGKKEWRALVEVKTRNNELDLNQLNAYLDLCRDYKIDALITISNQVLNASGAHPTEGIDQRKLRSTGLLHLSWLKVITDSLVLSEHKGVEDMERDLVLTELIRFMQSDASGASEFNDMGPSWTTIRESVKSGSMKKPDEALMETVSRFESLVRYSALTLSARLGVSAKEIVPRSAKSDYKRHLVSQSQKLIQSKQLIGSITIPGAPADLEMSADLGSGLLHCRFTISAPQEGRNKSRISWLTRQIKEVPTGTTISWSYKHARIPESPHSHQNLSDKNYEYELDNSRELSIFTIEVVRNMGTKRSSGKGGFIDSVVGLFEETYGNLLQNVKPWQPPAPKLSETVREIIPSNEAP